MNLLDETGFGLWNGVFNDPADEDFAEESEEVKYCESCGCLLDEDNTEEENNDFCKVCYWTE